MKIRGERITAPDADLQLLRGFIPSADADAMLARIMAEVDWRHDTIRVFGRTHPLPRLHQWFGDPGKVYTWSGIRMEPQPWIAPVQHIRRLVEDITQVELDAVLVNLYRNGDDTVGWHADDEPELGPAPLIASVSLGAARDFQLRHRDPSVPRVSIRLPHGSLLIMAGATQTFWQHAVPRRKGVDRARVNLTFRSIGM